MTRYLDVSVVRIQDYLTRAPSLKGRRGASTMISEASRAVRDALPDGTGPNAEAGAVDGVVSLVLEPGADVQPPADAILSRLRRALPAADLYAALSEGPTYTAARGVAPAWELHWVPAVPEWPLAKPCDWCRTWPSTSREHTVEGHTENYCSDCTRRADAAGAARDRRPDRTPGPERDLVAAMPGSSVPDDFDALADLGSDTDHTHVVTIYADGNGIGDYMKARGYRPELAAEIHRATWAAVTGTVREVADGDLLPVIPHLVGGDDVLISLPAHQVWPGLRTLLTGFGAAFPAGSVRPTLSAGVVVHHRKHPLSDVVDLAAGLLASAKRSHTGQAAFAWHSVTHDGAVLTDRPAQRLDVLATAWPALHALHAQPAAARQQLGRLCRDGDAAALDAHIARLGQQQLLAPFRSGHGIGLDDALSMLRWWQS